MTDHIKVEESYVEALIEQGAWDVAHIPLVEAGKKKAGQSKGDEPKGKAKEDDDKPDFTTDARKGDKSKTHKGKDFEKKCPSDKDEMEEAVEEHVCPLCETVLDEALTNEQVFEHVAQISKALQTIEEAEDEDDVIDAHDDPAADKEVAAAGGSQGEADAQADAPADADEHPTDKITASRKSKGKKAAKVMKKVASLKKAAQAGK